MGAQKQKGCAHDPISKCLDGVSERTFGAAQAAREDMPPDNGLVEQGP